VAARIDVEIGPGITETERSMPRRQSTAPTAVPAPDHRPRAGAVLETYRGLRAIGWSDGEAGNLAAYLEGIGRVRNGWTIREVEGLLFIRALVTDGRIAP
jgi:hypothetical protein